MPTSLHGASSHRKEGQFILFASRKLLHHPATAPLEAPARCPRAGTRLPRELFQTLRQPHPAVKPPLADSHPPSGPPHLTPDKATKSCSCLARSKAAQRYRGQGKGGSLPAMPEEIKLPQAGEPGEATYPEDFRICSKSGFQTLRSCFHSTRAAAQTRLAGGWGGKEREKRTAKGWSWGPHPASPGAQAGRGLLGR